MKRIILLLFVACLPWVTFAQAREEPKLEGYALFPVPVEGSGPTVLIAKYLQIYAAAPNCTRIGQLYHNSATGKLGHCTVTGTPGTWEYMGTGAGSGTVATIGCTTAVGVSCTSDGNAANPRLTFALGAITPSTVAIGSGANKLNLAGSTTGNPVTLTATGSDANIGISLAYKWTDSNAAVVVGTSQAIADLYTGQAGFIPGIVAAGEGTDLYGAITLTSAGAGSNLTAGSTANLINARGTLAAPQALQSGDYVANVQFGGHDGTAYQVSSFISAIVDGAVSAGHVPIGLEFWTGDGATTGKRLSIGSTTGLINIPGLNASQAVFTDASKNLVSVPLSPSTLAYQSSDFTNATTTLNNTSLSVTLGAGKTYAFVLQIFVADSTAVDGFKIDFGGGAVTATNFIAGSATSLVTGTTSTLAGTFSNGTLTGTNLLTVSGSIEVNAGGTFIVRAAQNAHTAGTLTVSRGSTLTIVQQ